MHDRDVLEELHNIVDGAPLDRCDTMGYSSAKECVARGWAERDSQGCFVPTDAGRYIARQHAMIVDLREAMQSLRVSNGQCWKIIDSSRAASRDMFERLERLRLVAAIRGYHNADERLEAMREILRDPLPTGAAGGEYCPPAPKKEQ